MDTIDMNIVQAQIGSLATDLALLGRKVNNGGGGGGSDVVVPATIFYYFDDEDNEYTMVSVAKKDLESIPLVLRTFESEYNYYINIIILSLSIVDVPVEGWYATTPDNIVTVSNSDNSKIAYITWIFETGSASQAELIYDSDLGNYYRFSATNN